MFEFYNFLAVFCATFSFAIFLVSLLEGFFNDIKYWLLAAIIFCASALINVQYEVKEVKLFTPDSYVLNEKTGTSYFMFGENSRTSHFAVHYLNPSNVVLKTVITTTGNWVKHVDNDGGTLVIKKLE